MGKTNNNGQPTVCPGRLEWLRMFEPDNDFGSQQMNEIDLVASLFDLDFFFFFFGANPPVNNVRIINPMIEDTLRMKMKMAKALETPRLNV